MVVGLLHPGEMGAAVGAALRAREVEVLWVSAGRSHATAKRAREAGLVDAATPAELVRRCDVILSVCPPHAAAEVARSVEGFAGVYVDANAISPATARSIASMTARYVDGGICGPPPREPGRTRLYLSGAEAGGVAGLFAGTPVEACVLSEAPWSASALKMAFGAWTKGSAALLLAVSELARREGLEEELAAEWATSLPELAGRLAAAERSAAAKGWRWTAEMEEIAATFAAADLPDGFHRAAAEIFRAFR